MASRRRRRERMEELAMQRQEQELALLELRKQELARRSNSNLDGLKEIGMLMELGLAGAREKRAMQKFERDLQQSDQQMRMTDIQIEGAKTANEINQLKKAGMLTPEQARTMNQLAYKEALAKARLAEGQAEHFDTYAGPKAKTEQALRDRQLELQTDPQAAYQFQTSGLGYSTDPNQTYDPLKIGPGGLYIPGLQPRQFIPAGGSKEEADAFKKVKEDQQMFDPSKENIG